MKKDTPNNNDFNKRFDRLEDSIEKLAQITARGFADVDKKHEKFKAETAENFKTVRRDILSTGDRFVMQDSYYKKISHLESRLDNQDERIAKILDRVGKIAKS
jgi:hypothetical protein